MPSNLYQYPEQQSGFPTGALLGMGAFLGIELAYGRASRIGSPAWAAATRGGRSFPEITENVWPRRSGTALAPTPRVQNLQQIRSNVAAYKKTGMFGSWGRSFRQYRMRSRLAGKISGRAWAGFFDAKGAGWGWEGLKSRWKAAGKAIESIPGIGASFKGKAPILSALARGPLGFVSSYLAWGAMIPASVELGIGMFEGMAAEGARLRGRRPETIAKNYDMATRQQAFTMRQASLMAMHQSQVGLRSSLGHEASFLH